MGLVWELLGPGYALLIVLNLLVARGSVHVKFDVPASLSKCKNVVRPQGGIYLGVPSY